MGHDWFGANMLCSRQDKFLCGYDAYCPNGQGGAPFGGGPPKLYNSDELEETQWSPFYPADDAPEEREGVEGSHWVQVGRLPEGDGGSDDNDFGRCWRYGDYYAGSGVDIEDVWEGEHRVWILCCDAADGDAGRGRA